jgi:hypothetical protein
MTVLIIKIESSPMHNDRFDHKNWSTQKNKCKVIKQVYVVKKMED